MVAEDSGRGGESVSSLAKENQWTIAEDMYGNKVFLHKNSGAGYDFQTDTRIYLTQKLALCLAEKLLVFAEKGKLPRALLKPSRPHNPGVKPRGAVEGNYGGESCHSTGPDTGIGGY